MKNFIVPDRSHLVAEYLLDGGDRDTSGNGYHGIASGVVYEKTDIGYQTYAGKFDGIASKVDLPTLPGFSSFSIIAVFRTANPSATQHIVRIAPMSDNANVDLYIESGQLKVNTYNGSGVSQIVQSGTLVANTTYFACLTNNAGTGTLTVRSDSGETVATGTCHNITFGTNYCSIGYGRQWNANFANGVIQSVRIFNAALSKTEIRNWYLESLRALGGATLGRLMSGVIGFWDFRGDASDIVGGNDGIVTGATLTSDRFGKANGAYNFSGSGNKIDTSLQPPLNDFTVITSVARNGVSHMTKILCWQNNGMHVYNNGHVQCHYFDGGSDNVMVTATPTVFTDNDFHTLAWTKSSTEGQKAFVDGELVATHGGTSNMSGGYGTGALGIGYTNWANSDFCVGRMEWLMLLKGVRSQDDIKAIAEMVSKSYILPFA